MLDNDYYTMENSPAPYLLRVNAMERAQSLPARPWVAPRRRRDSSDQPFSEENRDHFDELAAAAKMAHPKLVHGKIPFRFCVYRQGEDVLIDVAQLDDRGRLAHIEARNISREGFGQWVVALDRAEGVIVDTVS